MYPFALDWPYVRNAWYAAAFSGEIGRDPIQRTIMDEPIALYRTTSGQAHAMWGLCPHRHYPLVKGSMVGDDLQCGYHGYRYAVDGTCTRIPGQDTVPRAFRQRVYPCIERGGLIWLWMGDSARPDPGLMPPLERVGGDQPGWKSVPNEMTTIPARWSLMIDNLMDLSHIGFLHLKTIDAPAAGDLPPGLIGDSTFKVVRILTGDAAAKMPYRQQAVPDLSREVELEIGTEFFTPGFLVTYLRIYEAGSYRQRLIGTSYHYQGVTPHSRDTTLGFSLLVRNVRTESTEFDEWLKDSVSKTRAEDAEALGLVERYVDHYADARQELSGINDMPAIQVRRHLGRLLEAEAAAAAPELNAAAQ